MLDVMWQVEGQKAYNFGKAMAKEYGHSADSRECQKRETKSFVKGLLKRRFKIK